jgi:hypothetical protein
MKRPKIPSLKSHEELQSLPVEGLVEIILRQQEILVRFEKILERLENQTPATSETSSKPPSSDILQRSEHAPTESSEPGKRKAGVYNGYPVAAQQKCLAHLRRALPEMPNSWVMWLMGLSDCSTILTASAFCSSVNNRRVLGLMDTFPFFYDSKIVSTFSDQGQRV